MVSYLWFVFFVMGVASVFDDASPVVFLSFFGLSVLSIFAVRR